MTTPDSHSTPELSADHAQDPTTRKGLGPTAIMVGFVAVVTALFVALFAWSAGDPTLELEEAVAAGLTQHYGERTLETWCDNPCSLSADEWHTVDSVSVAAEIVRMIAVDAGATTELIGASEVSATVAVSKGSVRMVVGLTSPEWVGATASADGTAVWFNSVTLLGP